MAQHKLHHLPFASLTSERWAGAPDFRSIKAQIASAALAHCEVSGETYGLFSPPDQIRAVTLTTAAADQIRTMWHGHREEEKSAPPVIPLNLFVVAYGQENGRTWAEIEVHPGMDDWEALTRAG